MVRDQRLSNTNRYQFSAASRWLTRALACCLIFGAALPGCRTIGPGPSTLEPDAGGIITVAPSDDAAPRLATYRRHLMLSAPTAGALWSQRLSADLSGEQGNTAGEWLLIPRQEEAQLFSFVAPLEGVYRIVQTSGDAPGEDVTVDDYALEVHFDQTAPTASLDVRKDGGDAVRFSWVVDDGLPLRDGVRLSYSGDGGRTWRRLVGDFARSGQHRWAMPARAKDLMIRLDCADLAGNSTRREAALSDNSEAGEITANNSGSTEGDRAGDIEAVEANAAADVELSWFDDATPVPVARGGEARSYLFPGAARVSIPLGVRNVAIHGARAGENAALSAEGDAESVTTLQGVALLPRWTGGPYRLAGLHRGVAVQSPSFWLDSTPPQVDEFEVRGSRASLRVQWRVSDEAPDGFPQPSVWLHYRDADGKERNQELGGDGTEEVPVRPGDYRIWIVVRDLAGNTSGPPTAEALRSATVGNSGPRPLNFSGETFAAGSRHLLFMVPGPAGTIESPVQVRVLAVGSDTEFSNEPTPPGASSWLVEVPRVTGGYWLELSWVDVNGKQRSSRGEEPFHVDGDPPHLRWVQTPAETNGSARLILESIGAPAATVSELALYRRTSPTGGEWQPWPTPVPEPTTPSAEEIQLDADFTSWAEGEWEIAVVAADEHGNRTEPLAALPIRIDRTAPDASELRLPEVATEGVAVQLLYASEDVPGGTEVIWMREGHAHETRRVAWHESSRGWVGAIAPLPVGSGRLLVTLADPAGNPAERSAAFRVEPAVSRFTVEPGDVVDQGSPVFVTYRLSEKVATEALEVQIRKGDSIVARQALQPGRSRVVIAAPEEAGEYLVGIARVDGELFSSATRPLNVRQVGSGRSITGSGPRPAITPGTPPTQDGGSANSSGDARTAAARDSVEDQVLNAQLVAAFRAFQGEWQLGERGPSIVAERQQLVERLQARLLKTPRHVALRKALARLLTLSEEPDYKAALWVLERGVTLGGSSADMAALLADAGVIALQARELDVAEKHLVEAIGYEDNAHRRYNLGLLYQRRGEALAAEAELRRAIALAPKQRAILRTWARVVQQLAPEQRQQALGILDDFQKRGVLEQSQVDEATSLIRAGR